MTNTEQKEKSITIKLPAPLVKKVDALAKDGDRSRAAQVRRLLINHPDLQGA